MTINDEVFEQLCNSTEDAFLSTLFTPNINTVTFEETHGGIRIMVNSVWIGWLLSTTNSQWTFTILKKYQPNDPFKTKEEAMLTIHNFISSWHQYLDKKFGERKSARMDFNQELSNIYQDLASKQTPIPPDIAKTINENFDKML